jgi:hypothetical protein
MPDAGHPPELRLVLAGPSSPYLSTSCDDFLMQPSLPDVGSSGVSGTRYPTLVLCLIAGALAFALMVQCAIGVMVALLVSSPADLGRALSFGFAGLAPGAAALGAWSIGTHELERRVRTFKTVVVTLVVEAAVLMWLSAQGIDALNVQWVHWL